MRISIAVLVVLLVAAAANPAIGDGPLNGRIRVRHFAPDYVHMEVLEGDSANGAYQIATLPTVSTTLTINGNFWITDDDGERSYLNRRADWRLRIWYGDLDGEPDLVLDRVLPRREDGVPKRKHGRTWRILLTEEDFL